MCHFEMYKVKTRGGGATNDSNYRYVDLMKFRKRNFTGQRKAFPMQN